MSFSDAQIKYMRDRFLNWTLPYDLKPDGGISYRRSESAIKYNHPGPVGTNFLDATQAEAMVRHMVDGMPLELEQQVESLRADLERERIQHAGCLTAAEGWAKDPPKKGEWAWSPAFQAVLDLRAERDSLEELRVAMCASLNCSGEFLARVVMENKAQLAAEKQRADALEALLRRLLPHALDAARKPVPQEPAK